MHLTDQQARQLRLSLKARAETPTVARYMRWYWRVYLVIAGVGVVGTGFYWWFGWRYASMLVAGVVIGVLLRDIRWLQQFVRGWPLSIEITDWARVEQLLAEYDESRKK